MLPKLQMNTVWRLRVTYLHHVCVLSYLFIDRIVKKPMSCEDRTVIELIHDAKKSRKTTVCKLWRETCQRPQRKDVRRLWKMTEKGTFQLPVKLIEWRSICSVPGTYSCHRKRSVTEHRTTSWRYDRRQGVCGQNRHNVVNDPHQLLVGATRL